MIGTKDMRKMIIDIKIQIQINHSIIISRDRSMNYMKGTRILMINFLYQFKSILPNHESLNLNPKPKPKTLNYMMKQSI